MSMMRRLSLSFAAGVLAIAASVGLRATPGSMTVGFNKNISNQGGHQHTTDIADDPTNSKHLIGVATEGVSGTVRIYETFDTFTFTTTDVPDAPSPHNVHSLWPSVMFNASGDAFVAYAGANADYSQTTIVISKKANGASTWGAPVTIANTNGERPRIAIDRHSGLPNPVYVAFANKPSGGMNIQVAQSLTNNGASFTTHKVNDPADTGAQVTFPQITIGIDGDVIVGWTDWKNKKLWIDRSVDSGTTWGVDQTVYTWSATGTSLFHQIPAHPQLGIAIVGALEVDRTHGAGRGTVYCVFNDVNGSNGYDILLKTSPDGSNWSAAPVRVNTDAAGVSRDQFMPRIAIDDGDATVSLFWYDTRDDANNQKAKLYFALSSTGYGNSTWVQNPSDESIPTADSHGYGEYFGTTWEGDPFNGTFMLWTDSRLGAEDTYFSNVIGFSLSDYTMATPAAATAAFGATTSQSVSTNFIFDSFNGDVDLSATGLPEGATASFSPATIYPGASSMMTIDPGVALAGTYTMKVTGRIDNRAHNSSGAALTISPGFSIAVSPTSLNLKRNSTSTVSVPIASNLSSDIALSISGLPSGVTGLFVPSTSIAYPGTAMLRLSASSSATTGTSTVTITGTADGITHTATLSLTVATATGSATTTTLTATAGAPVAGQAFTLTATVKTGSTPVTAGTVAIVDGSTGDVLLANGTPNASGVVTASATISDASAHAYVATFTPTNTANFLASVATKALTLMSAITAPAYPGVYINTTSSALTFGIAAPPAPLTSVTITPSSTGAVFTPASLTFTSSGPLSQTLTVKAPASPGANSVTYTVTGLASDYYTPPASGTLTTLALKTITTPSVPSFEIGSSTPPLTVSLSAAPDAGTNLSITPSGTGLIFTPAVLTFAPGQTSATLTVSAGAGAVPGNKSIGWTRGDTAATQYSPTTGSSFSITSSVVVPSYSSPMYVNLTSDPQTFSVVTDPGPGQTLTITPSATGVTFSPSSLTFGAGGASSQTLTMSSSTTGTKTISYALSGSLGSFYAVPPPSTVTIRAQNTVTTPTLPSLYVNETSSPLTVSLTAAPDPGKSLTIALAASGATTTPSSLTFTDSGPTSQTFTIRPDSTGNKTLNYGTSGSAVLTYAVPAAGTLTVKALKTISTTLPSVVVGTTSSSVTMTLSAAPDSGTSLTVTPSAIPNVTFTPASLTFAAGQTSTTYTITAAAGASAGPKSVSWALSGSATTQYAVPSAATLKLTSTISFTPWPTLYEMEWGSVTFSLNAPIDPGLQLGLVMPAMGPDVNFSPSSVSFDNPQPSSQVVSVVGNTPGTKTIACSLVGAGAAYYATPNCGSLLVVQKKIWSATLAQSGLMGGQSQTVTLTLTAGPKTGTSFTLTPVAKAPNFGKITLSPPSVTFTSGGTLTQTVTATADAAVIGGSSGFLEVDFQPTGSDAVGYLMSPTPLYINYSPQRTITPPTYPTLYTSQTSSAQTFTIAPSAPDGGTITITPSAAGAVFTPSSLTWSSVSALSQTLTVKAPATSGTIPVTYAISGAGAGGVAPIAPGTIVFTNRDVIAVPALSTQQVGTTSQTLTMTLNNPPLAGTSLTVTPSGTDLTFSPASLTFGSGQTSADFTIAAGAFASTGNRTVSWTTSGSAAVQFAAPANSTLPLTSPVTPPAYPSLIVNQVSSSLTMALAGSPPANTSVVVTPSSPGVTFSPASLTFNAGAIFASFTVKPTAGGQQTITYALSGTAAAFYTQPAPSTLVASQKTFTIGTVPDLYTTQGYTLGTHPTTAPTSGTSVTLTPSAPGITFSPASQTFTGTGNRNFSFNVSGATPGPIAISWAVNGTDAAAYAVPAPTTFNVLALKTVTPPSYPDTHVNDTAAPLTFTISAEPPDSGGDLVITPSASGVTFAPASLTFVNGGPTSQTLTATPTTTGTKTISYLLTGGWAWIYSTPPNGTMNVTSASSSVTVTVTNPGAVYDGQQHGAAASVTGNNGLNQTLTVTYTGRNTTVYNSATPPINAGDYTASASFAGDATHDGSSGSTDFTIAQAPLTITANSASRAFGEPKPAFTGTIVGLVEGDFAGVSYSSNAVATTPAGVYSTPPYAIIPSFSAALLVNYLVTTNLGTLTITDFIVAATPSQRTTASAPSSSYTVSSTAINGFSGPLTLSVSGLPAGAMASFSPPTPGVGANSTLTVSRGTAAPTSGFVTLTITATSANGATSHTTTVQWLIRDYTVSVSAGPTMSQGASGTATVTVASPGGFAGGQPIDLTVSGLPAGVSASFSISSIPSTPLPATSTLTLTADASAVPGSYPITVTGTSVSLAHSATLTLTIQAVAPAETCADATPSIGTLPFPLDHGMRSVSISGLTAATQITGICQDENPNLENIAAYAQDGSGIGTPTALLRAEFSGTRAAPSNGRVYTVYFTAPSLSCSGSVKVRVNTSTTSGAAIDGGPIWNSVTGANSCQPQ